MLESMGNNLPDTAIGPKINPETCETTIRTDEIPCQNNVENSTKSPIELKNTNLNLIESQNVVLPTISLDDDVEVESAKKDKNEASTTDDDNQESGNHSKVQVFDLKIIDSYSVCASVTRCLLSHENENNPCVVTFFLVVIPNKVFSFFKYQISRTYLKLFHFIRFSGNGTSFEKKCI